MYEIASNCIIPDYGASWQKLRSGDFSGLPSLTNSESINSLSQGSEDRRYSHDMPDSMSYETLYKSDADESSRRDKQHPWKLSFTENQYPTKPDDLVEPPQFMLDIDNACSLDRMVHSMMSPAYQDRPTADNILEHPGCQWVFSRRRAGATIWEGKWGPADHTPPERDIQDEDMLDALY